LAPWRFRGWRRKSRYYLARLWLALGSLESLQRRWAEERRNFARTTREAEIEDLFRIDSSDEIEALRELDPSLIESSIQHAASRLDTSAVIYATVGGGIAGAVAAALITLL
jgi:hypothetical protein